VLLHFNKKSSYETKALEELKKISTPSHPNVPCPPNKTTQTESSKNEIIVNYKKSKTKHTITPTEAA
jgi:hypothetical protein